MGAEPLAGRAAPWDGIAVIRSVVPVHMTSRDDALVDLFIPVLNDRMGMFFSLRERPDELVRDRPQIEAVAVDASSGAVLRIEHTRLEPFEGEGADWGRLRDIADAIEGDASIRQIGRDVDVEFAVGAFDGFEKWGRDKPRVIAGILDWLRGNVALLPEGLSDHALNLPENIAISADVDEFDGAGRVFVSRRKPPDSLYASLHRSITRKLPKLLAEPATANVLLLEKYVLFPGRHAIGGAVRQAAATVPDLSRVELWIADTNGWHSDQTVGFYRVWPGVDQTTAWVREAPEVPLLHRRHLMPRT
jgi:hypothetical protein